MSKVLVPLALAIFLSTTKGTINHSCSYDESSGQGCYCWHHNKDSIGAKCRGRDISKLGGFVQDPSKVSLLDLSNNGLKHLSSTDLSNFTGLRSLNLSNNPLVRLDEFNLSLFPNLSILDVTGNPHWLNASHLEKLRMLSIVRGTPLDDLCLRCFLVRNLTGFENGISSYLRKVRDDLADTAKHPVKIYKGCYGNYLVFKNQQGFAPFEQNGFELRCKDLDARCFNGYASLRNRSFFSGYSRVEPLNRCWKTINHISTVLIVFGAIATCLNLTVVMVTIRSKIVRKNVAQFLVGVVAFGDFVMGLYLLIITITRRSVSYEEMTINLQHSSFCYFVGFVSIFAQGISAFSSFAVTIERYLAVVFCLNPDIRLFPSIAYGCLGVAFTLAFLSAIFPFTVLHGTYVPDSHCLPVSEPTSGAPEYMMIPGGLAFILYFLTVLLYIHMYIYVTKSSQMMGVQREGKVARKIALVVMSNVAFCFIPIILLLLVNFVGFGLSAKQKGIFWKTFNYICFAVNACLNPVLFAFRNEKFRQALKKQLHIVAGNGVAPLPRQTNSTSRNSRNLTTTNSSNKPVPGTRNSHAKHRA